MRSNTSRRLKSLCLSAGLLLIYVLYLGSVCLRTSVTLPVRDQKAALLNSNTGQQDSSCRTTETGLARSLNDSLCQQITHVVYIKVPKTGSTTIASILLNFGVARNLTFALSQTAGRFGFNPLRKEDILPIAEGKHYDLLVHHCTYNRETIKEVFPKDTKIIASVREPLSRHISHMNAVLGKNSELLKNATEVIKWKIKEGYEDLAKDGAVGHLDFNRFSLRMGITFENTLDVYFVKNYIRTVLDPDLDFVLVQEYFDESLVLLKRRFCSELKDIIYISHHVNRHARRDHVYTDEVLQQHKHLAVADYLIYDHFYTQFWTAVWKEGPLFFEEVRVFKGILNRVVAFCSGDASTDTLKIPPSDWNSEFAIYLQHCSDLRRSDKSFGKLLKQKQEADIVTSVRNNISKNV